MANNFVNPSAVLTGTDTTIYQYTGTKSAIVFASLFANTSTNNTAVTIKVIDDSATVTRTLGNEIPIPANSTLDFGKIVLEPNDTIVAFGQTANAVTAFLNTLEII